jgi:hypothetical protein
MPRNYRSITFYQKKVLVSARARAIYVNIERTMFELTSDEFTVKVAGRPEEVKSLLETGFEHVRQKDNLISLRKRK